MTSRALDTSSHKQRDKQGYVGTSWYSLRPSSLLDTAQWRANKTYTVIRLGLQASWRGLRSLSTHFIVFLFCLWLAWVFTMCKRMTFMIIFIDLLIFFINYYTYTSIHMHSQNQIHMMTQQNYWNIVKKSQQLYRRKTATYACVRALMHADILSYVGLNTVSSSHACDRWVRK